MGDKKLKDLKLLSTFFIFNIKAVANYSKDFIVGFIIVIGSTLIDLIFIEVIFDNIVQLAGTSKFELVLMYAVTMFNLSIYEFFYGNLRSLKKYLFSGEFEIMLTKPIEIITHIRYKEVSIKPLINCGISILLMIYSINRLNFQVKISNVTMFVLISILGLSILSSSAIMALSFLFYTRYTFTPYDSIMSLTELVKYPLNIYPDIIKKILSIFFPIALLGYYPSVILIQENIYDIALNPFLIFVVLFYRFISRFIFKKSIKKFDGSGN